MKLLFANFSGKPPNMHLFNLHTHHPRNRPDLMEIANLRPGQDESGMAAYFSAGLHPWFLTEASLEADLRWLETQANRPEVLAIGEAGLDKLIETPWDLQMRAFQQVVEISELVHKPLIIHCVRAFEAITALKKQWKPTSPWIIHGFDKNPQTAAMLLKVGCYLSFGKALLRSNSHAAEALRQTPPGRYFLETDDAQELDIEAVYARAAEIFGTSIAAVSAQVQHNAGMLGIQL